MEATVDKDKSQPVSMQNIGWPLLELLRQQVVFKGQFSKSVSKAERAAILLL